MNNDVKKELDRDLEKYLKKITPLKPWQKKALIYIFVFSIFLIFTAFLLVFPFVHNQSALDILIEKFKSSKNFNTIDILALSAPASTWLIISWGITNRIVETVLLVKKRKAYMKKKENQGVVLTPKQTLKIVEANELIISQIKRDLLTTLSDLGIPIRGAIGFNFSNILNNINLNAEQKKEEIKNLLKEQGVKVEDSKALIKVLKDVKKIND